MIRRYSVGDVLQTHHLVYSGVKVGFITVYAEETLNIINCLFIFEQFRERTCSDMSLRHYLTVIAVFIRVLFRLTVGSIIGKSAGRLRLMKMTKNKPPD